MLRTEARGAGIGMAANNRDACLDSIWPQCVEGSPRPQLFLRCERGDRKIKHDDRPDSGPASRLAIVHTVRDIEGRGRGTATVDRATDNYERCCPVGRFAETWQASLAGAQVEAQDEITASA